jgi:hypothetical protein
LIDGRESRLSNRFFSRLVLPGGAILYRHFGP